MTNKEIKLLKNFITWQSLPFIDNLFTHEDDIIKKFDEWLRLNVVSDDRMTKEEALEILDTIPTIGEQVDALEMAIKALEQQSCEDKQDCEHCIHTYGTLGCCDMVNNEWIYDCDFGREQYRKEHGKPCEDCISREVLLKSIEEPMNWTDSEAEIQEQRDYENFVALVNSMSPVTPQPKIGRWIFCEGIKGKDNVEKCSCCQSHWKEAVIYRNDTQEYLRLRLKYCPNCGAKME